MTGFDTATLATIRHYLHQIGGLIDIVEDLPDGDQLWLDQLAPDMMNTGFHLAVAVGFAARAVCLPAGIAHPDIPETFTCATLKAYHGTITNLIAPIQITDLISPVRHTAGEARLEQALDDYMLRFAMPNMMFHTTLAYAHLRHAGVPLGKADFDGLHVYSSSLP